MNIFFLDRDPGIAASYHCDRHVLKMIIETAQLLSTACRLAGATDDRLYKTTHKNHPSSVWVRASRSHYAWTLALLRSLCDEYTKRYGKQHKTTEKIQVLTDLQDHVAELGWLGDPPECMPDECKQLDTVSAYREYYLQHKWKFATWKTAIPYWWVEHSV